MFIKRIFTGWQTILTVTGEIIPQSIINKLPSAELRPDQFDTDSLPDYKILDSILYQYIELQKPADKITGEGITGETVIESY